MCLSIAVFPPPRCTLSSPTCRFAPNLCYCLSLAVSFTTSLYSLVLRSHCRPEPNLCYSTLVPSHPSPTPSSATSPHYFRLLLLPTHPRVSPAYFLRTPRILRVTRLGPPEKVGNVNRVHGNRACPNPRSFLLRSIENIFPPSFALYSSLPTYNNTAFPSPVGDHTDATHPVQTNYSVL